MSAPTPVIDPIMAPGRRAGRLDAASGWMLLSAALLATMGALTHGLKGHSDWGVVALVRALVMVTTALVLVRAAKQPLAIWHPRTLWVRSLAGSFSLVCNFYALTMLPVADAVILSNLHPLWIVFITAFGRRRWPAGAEVVGVTFGLVGVVLIQRPDLAHAEGLAVVVAVVSSMSTSVALLGLHRLRGVDTRAVVAHFAATASLVALVLLAVRWPHLHPTRLDPVTVLRLVAVGVMGTAAQICLTRAYAAGAPSRVAVVGLTQVVFAMGFDVAIWGRSLDLATLLGFVLVLAPTTWLSIRSTRPTASPAAEPAG